MSGDSSATSMKVPTFDGKKDKFQIWWTRFQAYASVKKFKEALEEQTDLPATKPDADSLDASDDTNANALRVIEKNKVAWAQLTLAFVTEVLIAMMNSTKDTAWPTGLAHKVTKRL